MRRVGWEVERSVGELNDVDGANALDENEAQAEGVGSVRSSSRENSALLAEQPRRHNERLDAEAAAGLASSGVGVLVKPPHEPAVRHLGDAAQGVRGRVAVEHDETAQSRAEQTLPRSAPASRQRAQHCGHGPHNRPAGRGGAGAATAAAASCRAAGAGAEALAGCRLVEQLPGASLGPDAPPGLLCAEPGHALQRRLALSTILSSSIIIISSSTGCSAAGFVLVGAGGSTCTRSKVRRRLGPSRPSGPTPVRRARPAAGVTARRGRRKRRCSCKRGPCNHRARAHHRGVANPPGSGHCSARAAPQALPAAARVIRLLAAGAALGCRKSADGAELSRECLHGLQ